MNNMTDEAAKEFNLACAEYMGLELAGVTIKGLRRLYFDKSNRQIEFNPAHDSNDRDLVIDEMKLDVDWLPSSEQWMAETQGGVTDYSEDRRTAIIKCINKVLRNKYA